MYGLSIKIDWRIVEIEGIPILKRPIWVALDREHKNADKNFIEKVDLNIQKNCQCACSTSAMRTHLERNFEKVFACEQIEMIILSIFIFFVVSIIPKKKQEESVHYIKWHILDTIQRNSDYIATIEIQIGTKNSISTMGNNRKKLSWYNWNCRTLKHLIVPNTREATEYTMLILNIAAKTKFRAP